MSRATPSMPIRFPEASVTGVLIASNTVSSPRASKLTHSATPRLVQMPAPACLPVRKSSARSPRMSASRTEKNCSKRELQATKAPPGSFIQIMSGTVLSRASTRAPLLATAWDLRTRTKARTPAAAAASMPMRRIRSPSSAGCCPSPPAALLQVASFRSAAGYRASPAIARRASGHHGTPAPSRHFHRYRAMPGRDRCADRPVLPGHTVCPHRSRLKPAPESRRRSACRSRQENRLTHDHALAP